MKSKNNIKCLVVVAHPDDETIWMGGDILKNRKNHDFEIISLCRKDDADRAPKFFRACNELGAHSSISDLDDEKMDDVNIDEIINRIESLMKGKKYDYVFTHGANGEYGHKRHIEVHNAVKKMIEIEKLRCRKVFYFAYLGENAVGKFCYADLNANKFIKLSNSVHLKKMELIKNIYGFGEESFEVKSSGNVEAFNVLSIR